MYDSLHQSGKTKLAAVINAGGRRPSHRRCRGDADGSPNQGGEAAFPPGRARLDPARRVGGLPVQLALHESEQVIQDPWVLVPALFDPAYIGGRTATEHWDLTEQIFRDILVFTARPVRQKTVESQGAVFSLKHVKNHLIFGTKTVWRSQIRVLVSDIHRTIIDMLDGPTTGGSIQHVADCFAQYMQRRDSEPRLLIDYADQIGNGAVFKRLGFLAERHPRGDVLIDAAKLRLTKGYAKLDPTLDCSRLITRWRLHVPGTWAGKGCG